MKKISIYILLTLGVMLCGCRSVEEPAAGSETECAVRLAVRLPDATRTADDGYDALEWSTLRIYKVDHDADGSTERLVRKYSPVSELPPEVYLASGDYKVTVEAGDGSKATFSHKTYYGEQAFTLKPHDVAELPVVCKVRNIAVEVLFDESVHNTFEGGACVYVNAADQFAKEEAESQQTPTLVYTEDGIGYFLLPDGVNNLCWGFYGTTDDPDVMPKSTKTGIIELPRGGMLYTLRFKYTHDAEGSLSVTIQQREYEEVIEDHFNFSPQPVIKGEGFDPAAPTGFVSEPVVFTIDVINALAEITLTSAEAEYKILTGGQVNEELREQGISCEIADNGNATISLGTEFFENYAAGLHEFRLYVVDQNAAEAKATATIAVEGLTGIMSSDLWFGNATLGAVVTNPEHTNPTIRYRRISSTDTLDTDTPDSGTPDSGTEDGSGAADQWTELALVPTAEGSFLYTAEGSDFRADATYEFQLVSGGTEIDTLTQESERGIQLPNAGLEEWHKNGRAYYPYAAGGVEFWGTGNPGATTMGENYNVTEGVDDPRPGSSGTKSAKLETKKPSMAGIGKLAAGNLMVGSFGTVSGMGGTVNMGREFDFNARPRALRVWYKYTPKGTDKGRIYICLVKMTNGDTCHIVDTNNPDKTTFSPSDEFLYSDKTKKDSTLQGYIVGYGDLLIESAVTDWTELTLDINYRKEYCDEKPNVLILTAASSYEGDFFRGEVGSTLWVDDFEFLY